MALPNTNPTYEYLGQAQAEGAILGKTASTLWSSHGATPTTQSAFVANITTTATAETTTAVNAILAALRSKGIMAAA